VTTVHSKRAARILAGGAASVLAASLVAATHSSAAPTTFSFAHANDLFTANAPAAAADDSAPAADHATRSRLVQVNKSLLPATVTSPRKVTLNVFPDATFDATVQTSDTSLGAETWSGVVPDGYFYAARADNAMLIHVATPKGVYEVSSLNGSDTYRAIELNPNEPEATNDVLHNYVGPLATAENTPTGDESRSRIDVMVLYTPRALAGEGSRAAMRARIALAVAETNGGYAHSGVTTRVRLVHQQEVEYQESGSFDRDLVRLVGTHDGYMDNVHSMRNAYGADMVSLIIENTDYCGLADAIKATPSQAFTTVSRTCATGYYSTGHEWGHLQGARHDRYVDPTSRPYANGHGYINLGRHWRTIMAYDDECQADGFSCTRLQYWSNPHRTYHNRPTGRSTTTNYYVLNATAGYVASFRHHTVGEDADNEFSGGASGYGEIKGHWFKGKTTYYSNGLYHRYASSGRVASYGDVTYQVRMKRTGGSTADPNSVFIRGANAHSLTSTYRWRPSLQFQFTNGGRFNVIRVTSHGQVLYLKHSTKTVAVRHGGWNVLKIVAVGPNLQFSINNRVVWKGHNSALRVGQVGFGFYRSTGKGRLSVDWARVKTTPTANAGS
jgi:hypothetical protein